MHPVDFAGSNITLTKPDGMTDEQCFSLKALRYQTEAGIPYHITAWQPNKEDVEAIKNGQPIFLQIMGVGYPPSSLFTMNEQGEINQ